MAALWVVGTGDVNQMRGGCAVSNGGIGCASSRVDGDRELLIAGDVFLGVAIAGAVTGGVLLLTHGGHAPAPADAESPPVAFDVSPTLGGAFFSAHASF